MYFYISYLHLDKLDVLIFLDFYKLHNYFFIFFLSIELLILYKVLWNTKKYMNF